MKQTLIFLTTAMAFSFSAPLLAADTKAPMDHRMESMSHNSGPMHAGMVMTEGLVKKLDKDGGKVTLTHGKLPNGMAGMTMAFRVKEAAWLDKLKPGQKIRFAIDDTMTIVQIEPAP